MSCDKTNLFVIESGRHQEITKIINEVYDASEERGYNATNQIVGYLISGDPGYITSYQDARAKIQNIERSKILETLINEQIL